MQMQTIGEFYKEKILSLPKKSRKEINLPPHPNNLEIKKDLFGWQIYHIKSGKKSEKVLECRSEEEARYLKVFLEMDFNKVNIPKEDKYLNEILPELESLKKKTDEIVTSYLQKIVDAKLKKKLRQEVYLELASH